IETASPSALEKRYFLISSDRHVALRSREILASKELARSRSVAPLRQLVHYIRSGYQNDIGHRLSICFVTGIPRSFLAIGLRADSARYAGPRPPMLVILFVEVLTDARQISRSEERRVGEVCGSRC